MKRAADNTAPLRTAAAAERLKSVSTPEDGIAAVAEILSQLLGTEEFALFAFDASRTRLVLVASQGIDASAFRERALDQGLIGRVARRGAAFVARRASAITMQRAPDESSLTACIPLLANGTVMGVLAIFQLLSHKRKMVAGDMDLLDLLTAHGAIALQASNVAIGSPLLPTLPDKLIEPAPPGPGQLRQVSLFPGDIFLSDSPVEISTILGSCVAVCIWDNRFRFGGMSHFLLPESLPGQSNTLRFGDAAIPALLSGFERLGSQKQNLQAKIFGGASITGDAIPVNTKVGPRNTVMARTQLANAGIPIVAEDVGGSTGRRLLFRTNDGTAFVKRLVGA